MTTISQKLPVLVISFGIFFCLTGLFGIWLKEQPKPVYLNALVEPLKSANIAPP